jgi:hypothetical protein
MAECIFMYNSEFQIEPVIMSDEYDEQYDSPSEATSMSTTVFEPKSSDLFKTGIFREEYISPTENVACCNYCPYALILSIKLLPPN